MIDRLLSLIGVIVLLSFPAHAHDPHTHQPDGLAGAQSPKSGLCCDGTDWTVPHDWKRTEDGFKVLIGKTWIDVPKNAEVTNVKNPDMEAKVWTYMSWGQIHVRCFLPGVQV